MAGLIAHIGSVLFTFLLIPILLTQLGICSDIAHLSLDENEVQAFLDAAKILGKPDWNSGGDPCTNENFEDKKVYDNQVTCELLDNGKHVTVIALKGQNLTGTLPSTLAKLPYLQRIDLSRNLLSGSIPEEWASMKNLTYLSLAVNQLSGSIPRNLGEITSLRYLSFESNQLTGIVPPELGRLVNLSLLVLSDNSLTGTLPDNLTNLSNLLELRVSSNNFSGRLPDYFGSWRKLRKLEIQGSGFEGPIPLSIHLLNNVSTLRISDMNGESSKFPSLPTLKGSQPTLVLRNCNITGIIPNDLAGTKWKILDLSFNKLEGPIPEPLIDAKELYLSHNMLTGAIPDWINQDNKRIIDLSYNSLDERSLPSDIDCTNLNNLNYYRSFSTDRNLESIFCLNKTRCSKDRYSLHINCGGGETRWKKTMYEKDDDVGGAAKFVLDAEWGFSSSGTYYEIHDNSGYRANDNSILSTMNVYADARFAATYLTYYGLCFAKGNYQVTLLFSEPFFVNSSSFSILGRRKFDIYIQDKLVCKDFDIVANGSHKPVELVFKHIQINGTVEVRLYYTGRGSTVIPTRKTGVYGPLISAISVDPEFKTPAERKREILIAIGAAALLLCLVSVVIAAFQWKRYCEGKASREPDLLGVDLQTGLFTFGQIRAATNNFDPATKLGEGGFGSVYLGTLLDGTRIAVKKLSSKSSQGNREFVNELGMISGLHHPNLVRLYGCCVEGPQLFLIYEYMENNNLALALFGAGDGQLRLDWPTRRRICVGVARGLAYLHEESTIRIVHRDIKATNILLDGDLNAKISDFGLAKLHEEQNTHISTRVAGTIGYMAPEYALWGYLTYKADVYSFGVVLLEIVAGRSNMKQPDEKHFCLLDKAFVFQQQKKSLIELMDPRLGTDYSEEEALTMIRIALLCTNPSPALRPTMSEVLSMLQGSLTVPESYSDPNIQNNEWLSQACRIQQDQMGENETQSLILSAGAPTNEGSSRSTHDLYPVNSYPS